LQTAGNFNPTTPAAPSSQPFFLGTPVAGDTVTIGERDPHAPQSKNPVRIWGGLGGPSSSYAVTQV
jgi:hypothetical protein